MPPCRNCNPPFPTRLPERREKRGSRKKNQNKPLRLLREMLGSQPSSKASAETEDAARAAEPRRAGGMAQHPAPSTQLPAPSSQFPSLLETATAGPSGHAQGQPRCNLRSDVASSPHVKRAFYQLPPAHVKMERGYGEVLVLGQPGAQGAPLRNHGPLHGEPGSGIPRERRSLQSSLASQCFVHFAVRHRPALQLHRPSLLSGANNLIRILSDSPLRFLLC